MPSTFSEKLNLTLMATGENDNTWGDIANQQVFQFLEDAISKMEVITLLAADVTLQIPASSSGSPDGRAMMLDVQGSPGGAYNIIVPDAAAGQTGGTFTKVYLVRNSTGNSQSFTIKTAAGTGVTLQGGDVKWVFCDGTDVYQVTQDSVASATNADNLLNNGSYIAGDDFARLDLGVGTGSVQTFARGQNAVRVDLTQAASVTVNNGLSNAFRLTLNSGVTTSVTVNNPTVSNADADGQVIRIMIHDQTGGVSVSWGTAYAWANGQAPTLSGAAGKVDYLAFEYFHNFPGGGKWIGAGALDVRSS